MHARAPKTARAEAAAEARAEPAHSRGLWAREPVGCEALTPGPAREDAARRRRAPSLQLATFGHRPARRPAREMGVGDARAQSPVLAGHVEARLRRALHGPEHGVTADEGRARDGVLALVVEGAEALNVAHRQLPHADAVAADPRVPQRLLHGEPARRVRLQQVGHEILGLRTHLAPVAVREGVLSGDDLALHRDALLAPLVEGRAAGEENVEHDAHRPQVAGLRVPRLLEHLRRHVVVGPADGEGARAVELVGRGARLVAREDLGEAKVAQLDVHG
mmetsp:Transcript_3992/g.11549  ORF Transcript_3992/g.11549 Transcript_3992/m.11549 type:complete len:277 (+) Transcript_3992:655-1485(+)